MTPPQTSKPRRRPGRSSALRVIDDAGQTHLHDMPRIWIPWIFRDPEPVARAIRRQQALTGVDQSMGVVMGGCFVAYVFVTANFGLPEYLRLAGAALVGCAGGWLMWWAAHRRLESHWQSLGFQWTDAGLSRGLCPLCLYNLAGAEPDEHGLAQCAECGAAWRHARIRSAGNDELSRWRRFLNIMVNADARRKLQDDDGRTFAAERLSAIAARTAATNPQIADTARGIRRASRPARTVVAAAVVTVYLLPIVGLLGLWATTPVALPRWVLFMLPIMLVPAAAMLGAISCSEFGLGASVRRREMLAAGLCPVCASPELASEGNHAAGRLCGGCQAVWRDR